MKFLAALLPLSKQFAVVASLAFGFVLPVHAQRRPNDSQYQQAMAGAVRDAAEYVFPSVVTVEVIGVSGIGKGEVSQDAPTSGVIVGRGEVLVSSIVLRRPSATILVVLPDGSRRAATVKSRDHHRDLVLLTYPVDPQLADTSSVSPIQFPSSSTIPIGSTVIAMGRHGPSHAPMVSTGILSASGRLDGIALQTDARVSASMYGGPLIDLYGNVLGILIPAVGSAGAEDSTGWYDSGIAFAIPTEVIANKLSRLRAGEDIHKGLIGIVAGSRDMNEYNTTIADVRTRSPAEAAGLEPGDEVLKVAGVSVRRHQEIKQVLGSFDAGEEVSILVRRGDLEVEVPVTLTDEIPPLQPQRLGIFAADQAIDESPDREENEDEDELSQVVVTELMPGAPAADALQIGDVIASMNGSSIDSVSTLRQRLISAEPDKGLELKVTRAGTTKTFTVEPKRIAGQLDVAVPESMLMDATKPWKAEQLTLPDAANPCAFLMPPTSNDEDGFASLGFLMLVLEPGTGQPKDRLEDWRKLATKAGVVVCAVASEEPSKWQPKELQTLGNFASAVLKKTSVNPNCVAIAAMGAISGNDATAADAMAVAASISQSETFFGVAVSEKTRPPAVRLRENEPASSLQILVPVDSEDDLPSWGPAIQRAGYPIVLGGDLQMEDLLRWVRTLQAI